MSFQFCGLGFITPWKRSYFGNAFSKSCEYACTDVNICVGFQKVSLKAMQSTSEKTIAWIKKFDKGCNEWKCVP
jgi:hypothetical protein